MKKKIDTLPLLKLYVEEKYPTLLIADTLLIAENTRINRLKMKIFGFFFRLLPSPLITVRILPAESDRINPALLHRLGVQPFPDGEKLSQETFPEGSEKGNLQGNREQQHELQALRSERGHDE